MKRFLAVCLAAVLLLTPCLSFADAYMPSDRFLNVLSNELDGFLHSSQPQMHVTFSTPEGETYTTGIGTTDTSEAAFYAKAPEMSVIVTEAAVYLSNATGLTATQTQALIELLMSSASAAPQITEEDMAVLANTLMDVLSGISQNAFNLLDTSNALQIDLNLDALIHDLNTAIPAALTKNAASLDPVLNKIIPYLTDGATLTCQQLIDHWPELGLADVKTGVTATLRMVQAGDTMNITLGLMGHAVELNIAADGNFIFTLTPAGAVSSYTFNSRDLAILGDIVGKFFVYEENYDAATSTATIHMELTWEKIAEVLFEYAATLDPLLAKYDPWFRLMTGDTNAVFTTGQTPLLSAGTLAKAALQNRPSELFALDAEINQSKQTIKASGYLGNLDFTLDLIASRSGNTNFTATLTDDQSYTPLSMVMTGNVDSRGKTSMSLSSSEAIMGANIITFHLNPAYPNRSFTLSTDSDAYHIRWAETIRTNEFDLKLGSFKAYFQEHQRNGSTFGFSAPDYSLDAKITEDMFQLDSTYFGLNCTIGRNTVKLNGYLNDGYSYTTTFDLLLDEDNGTLSANVQTPYDGCISLSYQNNTLTFQQDGDTAVLRLSNPGHYQLLINGRVMMTLLTEVDMSNGHACRIRLLQGDTLDGDAYTLTISFQPQTVEVPANAQFLTPEEFIQRINDSLNAVEESEQQKTNRPTLRN